MKLFAHHHTSLLKAIKVSGLERIDFNLVKRKGRIRIQKGEKWFSYILRKERKLDEMRNNIVGDEYFELRTESIEMERIKDWNDVVKRFRQWLKA